MLDQKTLPGNRTVRGLVHTPDGTETCFGVTFPICQAEPSRAFTIEEPEERVETQMAGELALAISDGWSFGEWSLWGERIFAALKHPHADTHWTCSAREDDMDVIGRAELEEVRRTREKTHRQMHTGSPWD